MSNTAAMRGYILEGPGRPGPEEQLQVLKLHGVDPVVPNSLWHDRIEGIIRNGPSNLGQRNALIEKVNDGDTVVFSAPICLGISPDDADWLITAIHAAGGAVRIDGGTIEIRPGQDAAPALDAIRRKRKSLYQDAWLQKKGKK